MGPASVPVPVPVLVLFVWVWVDMPRYNAVERWSVRVGSRDVNSASSSSLSSSLSSSSSSSPSRVYAPPPRAGPNVPLIGS